jgi:hypothetical protein
VPGIRNGWFPRQRLREEGILPWKHNTSGPLPRNTLSNIRVSLEMKGQQKVKLGHARVEAGSNTSTVTLRVAGGDEKGSLKSETVKYGREYQGTRKRLRCIYKRQTCPPFREGAPQKQDRKCETIINILSWAPDEARHQDLLTDRQWQCGFDFQFVADLRRAASLQAAPREQKTSPRVEAQEVSLTVL